MSDFTVPQAAKLYRDARATLIRTVKDEIAQGLFEAFGDPTVENVIFGVSTSAYNDENAGIGVYGPLVNTLSGEEFERDDEYNLFYQHGAGNSDPRIRALSGTLTEAGWEFAAEALGVSYDAGENYGQEMAFIATRKDDGSYDFYEHDTSY